VQDVVAEAQALQWRGPHAARDLHRVAVVADAVAERPMSCTRKSENGWKLSERLFTVTVKVVVTWQPAQRRLLKTVARRC